VLARVLELGWRVGVSLQKMENMFERAPFFICSFKVGNFSVLF
jgi:hypothetical protein